ASCGADNIGLFVPYFVTLNMKELTGTILIFIMLIFTLAFVARALSKIPGIKKVVGKFSRWIIVVVYTALGVFIIYENETIQTFFSFLNYENGVPMHFLHRSISSEQQKRWKCTLKNLKQITIAFITVIVLNWLYPVS